MQHVTPFALGVIRQFLEVRAEKRQETCSVYRTESSRDISGPYYIVQSRYDHKAIKAAYDFMFQSIRP